MAISIQTFLSNTFASGISGYSGAGGGGGSGTGESGYSGLSGYSGFSGAGGLGESGYSGVSGFSGAGVSGYSGAGTSGYSGFSGIGTSGFSGFSGESGASTSGFSGFSGESGYSGIQGASGVSGFSGAAFVGSSGFSGVSGYSGISGYSSFSGFSGLSGVSGFSGIPGVYTKSYSVYFDGSGDLLSVGASSAFNFSTIPVTLEFWMYPLSLPGAGNDCRILMSGVNASNSAFQVFFNSSGQIGAGIPLGGTVGIATVANTVQLGTWQHVAVVLNGASSRIYYNGVSVASGTITTPTSSASNGFKIGFDTPATVNFNYYGYVSNVRVVNGTAVYTSNFTPPTSPLTAITNTVLLVCQQDVFQGVTTSGNPAISKFNPFGDTPVTGIGDSGYSGFTGVSGFSGYSSFSGISGFTGVSGFSGAAFVGSSGFSGESGFSGLSGYSSFSGISGVSGYSGSGVSGFSGAPALNWSKVSTNSTASAMGQYLLDTSGGTFTLNLPATPILGDTVVVADASDLTAIPAIIGSNGKTIEGSSDNVVIDYRNLTVFFVYDGTTWHISATTGPKGLSGTSGFSGVSGATPSLANYVTLTGVETLTNKTYTGVKETRVAMPANSVDLAAGNYFTKTITTATTFTATNVPTTGTAVSFVLELTNAGSQTITWFTGTTWAGGTAPSLTASGVDVLGFYTFNGGTTWRGLLLAKDIK